MNRKAYEDQISWQRKVIREEMAELSQEKTWEWKDSSKKYSMAKKPK